MANHPIFWMSQYIKDNRAKTSRYEIDLRFLRQGYDPGLIEDAWQLAGLNLDRKKPSFVGWLLPLAICSNLLAWFSLLQPWKGTSEYDILTEIDDLANIYHVDLIWLYLPALLWFFVSILAALCLFDRKLEAYKGCQRVSLSCIAVGMFTNLFLIVRGFDILDWPGPVGLTFALTSGLLCTLLDLIHRPRKIEIVLTH